MHLAVDAADEYSLSDRVLADPSLLQLQVLALTLCS